jgi:hypothetical protein
MRSRRRASRLLDASARSNRRLPSKRSISGALAKWPNLKRSAKIR